MVRGTGNHAAADRAVRLMVGWPMLFLVLSSSPGCESRDENADDWQDSFVAYMTLNEMFPPGRARDLARAAGRGDIGTLERLVETGVDPNTRGKRGATPLFWAMKSEDGFTRLLELGADPNLLFEDGSSVMHWAAQAENVRLLESALQHGGNPNLVESLNGETPLFEAIQLKGSDAAVIILLDAGADPNAMSKDGQRPIVTASHIDRWDLVCLLRKRGAHYDDRTRRLVEKDIEVARRVLNPQSEAAGHLAGLEDCVAK